MKGIFLMKVGPYNSSKDGMSEFNSVMELGLQKNNPGINKNLIKSFIDKDFKFKNIDVVLSSDLLRAKETVRFLKKEYLKENVRVNYLPILREILFDVRQFCKEKEFTFYGSSIIRKKFIDFFEKDKLPEKSSELLEKFVLLNKTINPYKKENVLIVSHTFFIKLFLIFSENHFLFKERGKIREYISPEKRIMNFCQITKFKKYKRL